jgi:flagellar hook-basal body complex protein FliE
MAIDSIRALGSIDPRAAYAGQARHESDDSFGAQLQQAIRAVDEKLVQRDDMVQSMVRGEAVEVHDIMTAAHEAQLAFDLMLEVRNKLLEAYQEIMRMQI